MTNCPGKHSESNKTCSSCPLNKICKDSNKEIKFFKIPKNLKIIIIMSGKGGVGKSTITFDISKKLSKESKVCILDLDIGGPSIPRLTNTLNNITQDIPVMSSENLFVSSSWFLKTNLLESTEEKIEILQRIFDIDYVKFDYLVVDTPPGISDEHLFLRRLPSDQISIILISTSKTLSLSDVRRQCAFIDKMNWRIKGLILNMSGYLCECGNEVDDAIQPFLQKFLLEKKIKILQKIFINQKIAKSSDIGEYIEIIKFNL